MIIPQPRFILRDKKEAKPTAIQCHIRYERHRIVLSTGEKIIPAEWDFDKQRAINSKKYPHNTELNAWIDKMENDIKQVFREINYERKLLSKEQITNKINQKLYNKSSNKIPSLFEFIEEFIQESLKTKTKATVFTYITTFRHLKAYSKDNHIDLDYSDIDLNFYNSFLGYLTQDACLSKNTVGKHIQVFKTFMNEATDRGYNKQLDFRQRKFRRLSEPVHSIYLNQEELDVIWGLDLRDKPNLERVRDLFIIGCYTGLRYSDFVRIKPEHIIKENGSSYIQMLTQKTIQIVVIPLKPIVKEILAKYGGFIPKPLTNQKMNKYLKVIGKIAGINQLIPIERTKGGKSIKELIPKYDLIRTHTCRKSFATNAFRAGLPTLAIMKITGHKTEQQFYRYVRISELENAEQLKNHEFFNS